MSSIVSIQRLKNALGPVPSSPANCCTQRDPDTVATYFINGARPVTGSIFRNPDLAKTFRLIQQQGRDVFYRGEIAQAIVAKSNALGGTMTLADRGALRFVSDLRKGLIILRALDFEAGFICGVVRPA